MGIPDFEFLWFFTLLLTMMMVEDEGDDGGSKGEDEGSEARSEAREVWCKSGLCQKCRRFLQTLRVNSGNARNQTLMSC